MTDTSAVVACADLINRAGGKGFQVAWTCPHIPDEDDGHDCPDVTWWAAAGWKGARLTEDGYPDPAAACLALATTVLTGASCRCGKKVALGPRLPGCRWRLKGDRWEPSCTADPLHVPGPRGDVTAMQKAMDDRKRHTNG